MCVQGTGCGTDSPRHDSSHVSRPHRLRLLVGVGPLLLEPDTKRKVGYFHEPQLRRRDARRREYARRRDRMIVEVRPRPFDFFSSRRQSVRKLRIGIYRSTWPGPRRTAGRAASSPTCAQKEALGRCTCCAGDGMAGSNTSACRRTLTAESPRTERQAGSRLRSSAARPLKSCISALTCTRPATSNAARSWHAGR